MFWLANTQIHPQIVSGIHQPNRNPRFPSAKEARSYFFPRLQFLENSGLVEGHPQNGQLGK